jgi:V8-like Glu-specific endopeptidase
MTIEVDTDLYPFSAAVFIEARFGAVWGGGSGFLIGRNDVLTAAHVIYNAALGGLADEILVYPSHDPDAADRLAYRATVDRYFDDFDPNADSAILPGDGVPVRFGGSELDIALLALSVDVGARYGVFGVDLAFGGGRVEVIGFPARYDKQPIYDSGTARLSPVDAVALFERDLEINVGNSGGPVFHQTSGAPTAAAVVSSGVAGVLIAPHWGWIAQAMAANDPLMGDGEGWSSPVRLVGGPAGDILPGRAQADIIEGLDGDDTLLGFGGPDTLAGGAGRDVLSGGAGDDVIDGGPGLDVLRLPGMRDDYQLAFPSSYLAGEPGAVLVLSSLNRPEDGVDVVTGVERLQFADGVLALDLGPPSDPQAAAGAAFRLYEAALTRMPDPEGMAFWLRQFDNGLSAVEAAGILTRSPEFGARKAAAGDEAALVTAIYTDVLGRPPDADGLAFWLSALTADPQTGLAQVLAGIANSPENHANVVGAIGSGVWLPAILFQ